MLYFLLYMLIGALSGTFSGLLGIGGGSIVIPFLAFAYKSHSINSNLIMHMAAGTSLAVMIPTTASSLRRHMYYGIRIWSIYKKFIFGIIVGTVLGAVFGRFLPSEFLQRIFGLFVFILSIRLILAIKSKPTTTLPSNLKIAIVALISGAISGILGIGAGTLVVPFLIYCNVRSTLTVSIACSLTVGIIGTITFILMGLDVTNLPPWSSGYVYWPSLLGIVLTGPLFARFGATLSHKIHSAILSRALGIVLLIIAIKMLVLP